MKDDSTKPKRVNYFQVPRPLWRLIKRVLPKAAEQHRRGRPAADNRAVLNGIWYVLWTGCQWKAVKRAWFGVCSSVLHERFQRWTQAGLFAKIMRRVVRYYQRQRGIGWPWQSVDSRACPAPLGGAATGPNPTDRAKCGSKVHILVDQRGAPLAVQISAANRHDKWSVQDLIVNIVVKRPGGQQHFCADKGYDYADVHQAVRHAGYIAHIKHRRRRGEPKVETCALPGELTYPARRWVVERTFSWLVKRRSLRLRWCKKPHNWLAFVQLACADILLSFAFYG